MPSEAEVELQALKEELGKKDPDQMPSTCLGFVGSFAKNVVFCIFSCVELLVGLTKTCVAANLGDPLVSVSCKVGTSVWCLQKGVQKATTFFTCPLFVFRNRPF